MTMTLKTTNFHTELETKTSSKLLPGRRIRIVLGFCRYASLSGFLGPQIIGMGWPSPTHWK